MYPDPHLLHVVVAEHNERLRRLARRRDAHEARVLDAKPISRLAKRRRRSRYPARRRVWAVAR